MPIRCLVMSDLHLEFETGNPMPGPSLASVKGEIDLVLLAGDIDKSVFAVQYARRMHSDTNCPVCFIAGNHEFYQSDINASLNEMRSESVGDGLYFLENDVAEFDINGEAIRVLGCVLWTDYALYGNSVESMRQSHRQLSDHKIILKSGQKLFTPQDALKLNRESRAFLKRELARPFDGYTVVMTHHAPSERSVENRFKGDMLTPAFASDLTDLVEASGAAIWIHGHMHHSIDYEIGRTRVVCNPRGYFGRELNPDFNPAKIVEIG